jgi:glycosyltransferase involved in cell wall biosynthesis
MGIQDDAVMRLLIIGTHPEHTTGYSRIMYGMVQALLEKVVDLHVTVFGIQRYYTTTADTRKLEHPRLNMYDVVENSEDDFGYGTAILQNFVDINQPDAIMIYNDSYVTTQYCKIIEKCKKPPPVFAYLDQIYEYQDPQYVELINKYMKHVICFSREWELNAKKWGITAPTSVMRHPVNVPMIKPSKIEARRALHLPQDTFIFLNLNRNQERKRPDLTIIGYVWFLARNPDAKVHLYMGNVRDETFDLAKIFDAECVNNGIQRDPEKYMTLNSKAFTDAEVHNLYAACDVGVNTCQGEGFGLCQYEHAMYGKPQIVSAVGGLKDGFDSTNSIQLHPIAHLYGKREDKIPDMPRIVDAADLADGMTTYYTDKEVYTNHANNPPVPTTWNVEVMCIVDVLKSLY